MVLRLLYIGFLGLSALCVFSLFNSYHWFFELCVHFCLQYAVAFCGIGMLLLGLKEKKLAGVSFVLSVILFLQLLPNQKTVFKQSVSQSSGVTVDVLSINLLSSNTNFAQVNALVESTDPDILVLIEFTSFWAQQIDLENYPHQIHSIREDNFGIGFYSKLPLDTKEIIDFTESRFPFVHAGVRVEDHLIHILATHYENPVGSRASTIRNFQMEESARFLNTITAPKLLIGDFNCSPYSHAFKSLLDNAELYDSRSSWSIGGSWPTFFFPLLIPIDHALVSEELHVTERKLLDAGDSDHKALFVRMSLN